MILRKIINIVATRCHILKLKCTKFDFGWGSAPDPAGGAHSASHVPLLDVRGPTCKENGGTDLREIEGEGKEGGKRKGAWPLRGGEGRQKEGRERNGRGDEEKGRGGKLEQGCRMAKAGPGCNMTDGKQETSKPNAQHNRAPYSHKCWLISTDKLTSVNTQVVC